MRALCRDYVRKECKSSQGLSEEDSAFLAYLRGLSIIVIVFGHVGGFWVWKPYSETLHVFVPVFFFISGATGFYSYIRSSSVSAYYIKRLSRLLIPYYLLCVLSFTVYLVTQRHLPEFDWGNIMLWLQVRPIDEIMPFPMDHVWFLHTLLVIVILSPIYLYIGRRNIYLLIVVMIGLVFVSGVQIIHDIDGYVYLMGNNLYKPIVHSSFFIFGIVYSAIPNFRDQTGLLVFLLLSSVVMTIGTTYVFGLNVDYEYHTFAPDLYYVAGSFSAIILLVFTKRILLWAARGITPADKAILFFNRHAFSVYLLHSFSIYVAETVWGLADPQVKDLRYGAVKFLVVIVITCILSLPYTRISEYLSTLVTSKYNKMYQEENPLACP